MIQVREKLRYARLRVVDPYLYDRLLCVSGETLYVPATVITPTILQYYLNMCDSKITKPCNHVEPIRKVQIDKLNGKRKIE